MKDEEIKAKYGDKLAPELSGKQYDVLSKLFLHHVGLDKILISGDFESSSGAKAVNCNVKAAEGYLFPLKSSLVFIHKPVTYIRHSELKHVEFSRTNQTQSRSFDLNLTKLKDNTQVNFASIDKNEQKILEAYFKNAGIKVLQADEHGKVTQIKDSPHKHKPAEYDDEDEDEEDESFKERSDEGSDDEEGEAELENESQEVSMSEDVDMVDEELDKKELAQLKKEVGDVDTKAGRPKRNIKK